MVDLFGKTYVYFLDMTHPDPENKKGEKPRYRVSIVIENEAGHFPTGNLTHEPMTHREPWYWTEEVCDKQNEKLGFNPLQAWKIVQSSMRKGELAHQ